MRMRAPRATASSYVGTREATHHTRKPVAARVAEGKGRRRGEGSTRSARSSAVADGGLRDRRVTGEPTRAANKVSRGRRTHTISRGGRKETWSESSAWFFTRETDAGMRGRKHRCEKQGGGSASNSAKCNSRVVSR
jgi:hypothetical protein